LEYEKTAGQNENIKFLYFNSVDNSQNYPKGNGETLYQLLDNFKLTDKAFVLWSDIIISNNRIFEEMYNLQYDNDFLIPTVYEEDPYAYLIIEDAKVKSFGYRRDSSIEYGYHDQSIFLVNTRIVKDRLKNIIDGNKYDEVNFLDVVSYIDGVSYYETKYPIISYNSFEDISSSFGQTS
jgi:NDP-sugar pyrophosphorylase family protein